MCYWPHADGHQLSICMSLAVRSRCLSEVRRLCCRCLDTAVQCCLSQDCTADLELAEPKQLDLPNIDLKCDRAILHLSAVCCFVESGLRFLHLT